VQEQNAAASEIAHNISQGAQQGLELQQSIGWVVDNARGTYESSNEVTSASVFVEEVAANFERVLGGSERKAS